MTFPRVAAPKRGHKTDYYQMSKIFGGLIGYTVGFSLIYEYLTKGISRRRDAWRNEPKRDMSASGMLTSQNNHSFIFDLCIFCREAHF